MRVLKDCNGKADLTAMTVAAGREICGACIKLRLFSNETLYLPVHRILLRRVSGIALHHTSRKFRKDDDLLLKEDCFDERQSCHRQTLHVQKDYVILFDPLLNICLLFGSSSDISFWLFRSYRRVSHSASMFPCHRCLVSATCPDLSTFVILQSSQRASLSAFAR